MAHLTRFSPDDQDFSSLMPIPSFRRTLITVSLIVLGLVLATGYSYYSFDRLVEGTIVRLEAVSAVLLETTEGHLWFEEILAGDDNEDISIVWRHLDLAEKSIRALIVGDDLTTGHVGALEGDHFQFQLQEILSLLQQFRATAQKRHEHATTSQAGTAIDQEFDRVFDHLITNTKILDSALRQESRRELFASKMLHLGLAAMYLLLATSLIGVLYRYDRNRTAAAELIAHREGQLRQAQKMEAVGNLAGGIAHDFNNLLQAIIGYGEVLEDDLTVAGRSTDEISHILTAGRRAADLTRQLLAYSRRQVIAPVDLDLNDLITNLLKMLQRLIGENITIDTSFTEKPVTVHADKAQMEQILMNLCINARDAILGAGTLSIETETVVIDAAYCADHPWARPGSYVLLCVTDDGCGMDQGIIDQVFEPFFTTKIVGKGTGLGLSTVYGIVKQNDGMVHVYSEIDHGSTFKVYWPQVDRPAMSESPTEFTAGLGGTETILLAEDDTGVREFATGLLEKYGYQILPACDGQEAIDIFDSEGSTIDLALLDVVMPHKSGREVMEHIRTRDADMPVIFASGYSLNAIHTDFILDHGIVLLEKPYRRHQLLTGIREALRARK